ncbi:hypothetical protein ACROYT_G014052 [Oculina patagonica]
MRKEQEQSLKNESYDYQHAADVQQEEWRDFLLENDQQEKAITREDLELRKPTVTAAVSHGQTEIAVVGNPV